MSKFHQAQAAIAEPINSLEVRISQIRDKRRRASEAAHALAAAERNARNPHERSVLASRRRDAEVAASIFEHMIYRIQTEAAE